MQVAEALLKCLKEIKCIYPVATMQLTKDMCLAKGAILNFSFLIVIFNLVFKIDQTSISGNIGIQ